MERTEAEYLKPVKKPKEKMYNVSPEVEAFLQSLKPGACFDPLQIGESAMDDVARWLQKEQRRREAKACQKIADALNELVSDNPQVKEETYTGEDIKKEIGRILRDRKAMEEIKTTARVSGFISYAKIREILMWNGAGIHSWPLGQDEIPGYSGLTDPD